MSFLLSQPKTSQQQTVHEKEHQREETQTEGLAKLSLVRGHYRRDDLPAKPSHRQPPQLHEVIELTQVVFHVLLLCLQYEAPITLNSMIGKYCQFVKSMS